MSRSLQDQFIDDDEEETCPLCVEEFDLTDKGFRPCPCGYQICQFCYHNVKTNMNGLCPACRRPYNDADIEYKVITPEETAAHKARQAQKQKKTQQALQKEKQKAEADNLSRKHLAGMRVVQKNLVYVTGLSPTSQEDQLLQTLRGDQYFGQYGKIIKIVVSKAKDPSHPHSVGVYVTYERKEDAASCIAAVDGSKNGDRTLRAQFGTTKYCSAYLRGENCTNRNCMFLHEPGEANESYSRADLSALNAGSSQQGSGRPPPPQSQQPVASAAPPMVRQGSSDQHPSSPALDRPALPSTASWASKLPQSSRAESRSTSGTQESPAPAISTPATTHPEVAQERVPSPAPSEVPADSAASAMVLSTSHAEVRPRPQISPIDALFKRFSMDDFSLFWSPTGLSEMERNMITNFPLLFDEHGGAKRRLRRQREEERQRIEQDTQVFQHSTTEQDDNPEMSGSLQLGGEPEERHSTTQMQGAIHPPGQDANVDPRYQYTGAATSSPGASDRGLTPQQHQQMLLQTLKPNSSGSFMNNPSQQSKYNASSLPQPPANNPQVGHQRNVSRYSFANEAAPTAASVKTVANPKLMNQQSAMVPPAGGSHFGTQHQAPHGQFYTSNVQGPPPGLKTTGTPPVSGNLTFGQGHGFATGGLQYGAAFMASQPNAYPAPPYANLGAFGDGEKQRKKKGKKHRHANTSSSSGGGMIDVSDPGASHLLQSRMHQGASGFGGGTFAGQAVGAADESSPPLRPVTRQVSLDESRRSTPPIPPGFEGHLLESRRSTPSIPPGLAKPTALPDLEGSMSRPTSRPSSRASLRRQTSQILPALPLRPATPHRISTPSKVETHQTVDESTVHETPTKVPKTAFSSDLKVATSDGPVATDDNRSREAGSSGHAVKDGKAALIQVPIPDLKVRDGVKLQVDLDHIKGEANQSKSQRPIADQADTTKRKHPGKLDISAAVNNDARATSTPSHADTQSVQKVHPVPLSAGGSTPSAAKPAESPMASPAFRTGPRTLRVVQTPRTEAPAGSLPPAPSMAAVVAAHKLPSRKPSVASINLPGTPSSEHVSMSDNISVASTSQSRANSPPPAASGKVGSAPIRAKTKSQQKKERQERAKALEEVKSKGSEPIVPIPAEPVVEAIQSRKKKTKREKEVRLKTKIAAAVATTDTTPTASRTPSPRRKTTTEASAPPEAAASELKSSTPGGAQSQAPRPTSVPSPPATPTLTPAQLIAELKASAPQIQKCIDSLFRVSNSRDFKTHQNVSHKDLLNNWQTDLKFDLNKNDVEALLTGKVPAIYYGGDEGHVFDRGMIAPSGANLRALTRELETRFLELERALREMPEESRFRPSKPQNDLKLPAIDLEAVKRQYENGSSRGPSVMEQMVQDGATLKKGAFLVDEASKYINEFVMPPVTPPPSAAMQARAHPSATDGTGSAMEQNVPSAEVAERQLRDAQKNAEERESALRKVVKKNKKLLGL
ncbi:hypothetical protein CERZMDRAFT_47499 [Cercospora zeae-maydis SCOH1-5]|uniref:RING-type domain-containing protein n=1 Tax=Cercospora zeae-maydis SCOH1-5 TaxID=717836 RepID=A0A6A6F7J9_9PEZI|nr:hypothetical protein CERZMDRAFT_47499 [Cercospora zeae-maydis SCOH1-5]